jgi:UV DNA damage endonuclease
MLSALLRTYRVLGRSVCSRIAMAGILPLIGSGVALRRSSRLSRVDNLKTTGTDLYAVQRREMAVSVEIRNEDRDLSPPTNAEFVEPSEEEHLPLGDEKGSTTRKRKKKSTKKVHVVEDGGEAGPPKKRRKPQPKPEPVYEIPDVERKETTFKGRLGTFHNNHCKMYDSTFIRICLSEHSASQQEASQ